MNIEMRENLYAMKWDDRKIQNRVFKARPFDKQNPPTQGNIEDVGTDEVEEMIQKNDKETPEQPLEDTLTEKTDEINPKKMSSEEKSNTEPVLAAALAPTPVLELTHTPEPEKNLKKRGTATQRRRRTSRTVISAERCFLRRSMKRVKFGS